MTAYADLPPSTSAAARFDHALKHARKRCTAPDRPAPRYSVDWPKANVALLDTYRAWLLDGGVGVLMVDQIYVPTAGYALGLNLKPVAEWDLEADLDRALDYIHARRLSAISTHIRHGAIQKFRHFLRQQRGQRRVVFHQPDLSRYQAELPAWLIEPLTRYQHLRQAGWRQARLADGILRFWSGHARLWRWLLARYPCHASPYTGPGGLSQNGPSRLTQTGPAASPKVGQAASARLGQWPDISLPTPGILTGILPVRSP